MNVAAPDDPGVRDAVAGAGEREEWGSTGHGTHPLLQKAAQSTSSVQPHEGWTTSWVSSNNNRQCLLAPRS